ncbi:MAG: hypothetical protein WEC34_15885 [Acidimicrobiia bacterium]
MSDEKEPTQTTEQGHEIPVPKRSAWDRLLGKVANPSERAEESDFGQDDDENGKRRKP